MVGERTNVTGSARFRKLTLRFDRDADAAAVEEVRAVDEPVIDRTFPFAEARAAFHHQRSGAHFGKVVVSFD